MTVSPWTPVRLLTHSASPPRHRASFPSALCTPGTWDPASTETWEKLNGDPASTAGTICPKLCMVVTACCRRLLLPQHMHCRMSLRLPMGSCDSQGHTGLHIHKGASLPGNHASEQETWKVRQGIEPLMSPSQGQADPHTPLGVTPGIQTLIHKHPPARADSPILQLIIWASFQQNR